MTLSRLLKLLSPLAVLAIGTHAGAQTAGVQMPWQPAAGPLMTRWAKEVSPTNALPEYPRPQVVREHWQSPNDLWDYAVSDQRADRPTKFGGPILMPLCIESALSGVMKAFQQDQRFGRRTTFGSGDFELKNLNFKNFQLRTAYVENAEVYINGVLAAKLPTFNGKYADLKISPESIAALKVSNNVIAIHCRQSLGLQFIDAGIVDKFN